MAIERETGVRALRSIMEDILLDLMYELPHRKDKDKFIVTDKIVRGEEHLARGLMSAKGAEASERDAAAADDYSEGPAKAESDERESA